MDAVKPIATPRPKLPTVQPLQQAVTTQARKVVTFGNIGKPGGHRVLLYGPGGIGKTTLAAQLPGPVAFIDLDESLPILRLDGVHQVEGIKTWQDLRDALAADGWDNIKTIVIDTATKAEEMAVVHTLQTVLCDNKRVTSIEGYGYGKGYGFVFDTFLHLLSDLDRHARAGRNVVLVCHDCTSTVPNPSGEDWIRYEPRLQAPGSGKSSIRLRVREWADHVLFIGYDVNVGKSGKGEGSGTRTMYTAELPHCMAKSRTTLDVIPIIQGEDVWSKVIK